MGFRDLLTRRAKPDEPDGHNVEHELQTPPPPPSRPKAGLNAQRDAAPSCLVSAISLAAEEKNGVGSKPFAPKVERRRAPSYVWRSQASRERRSEAMDFANTNF